MQGIEIEWSEVEQNIAKTAFETAYTRETKALVLEISTKASKVSEIDDIWQLHDFLSARRHDIDGKYDYSYSALIFVFSRLVQEKWLAMEELEGLGVDKLSKIAALSRMA